MKERHNRRSREEWERINALWEKDRKPQILFCKELGIEPSCFRYWRARLAKKIGIGRLFRAFPPTPPYVRLRIRRFMQLATI